MKCYDDKVVGLSIEPLIGTVRLLTSPAVKGDTMPGYVGSGTLVRVSHDIAKLIGFSGTMSIRHQRLIARALLARGYKLMYVERAIGGRVAMGHTIKCGDFAGHIRVDLVAVEKAEAHRRGDGG